MGSLRLTDRRVWGRILRYKVAGGAVRYLFVHQNFPAQYQHVVRHLAARPGAEVLFLTAPNANSMHAVTKAEYQFDATPNENCHPDARDVEAAIRRAAAVGSACAYLRKAHGYVPDVIIGHHGWGELLNVGDVWPGVPVLGYLEFYYHSQGYDVGFDPEFPLPPESAARIRARNTVNHLALTNPGWGQTPTEFQLGTYPEWARAKIGLIREGVDLARCRPLPGMRGRAMTVAGMAVAQGEKLVTFTARSLEPYRGYHSFIRAVPRLLSRPDVRVALVGTEKSSYGPDLIQGTWKDHFLREVAGKYDESRLHFLGHVEYDAHLALLARSDAHVYLTYPFVASWSLREALACGCAVVGSDTSPVREFVQEGVNGLLVPFFEPERIAGRVLDLLEDRWLDGHIREGARAFAERHLSMDRYLHRYAGLIDSLAEGRAPAPGTFAGGWPLAA